MKNLQDKVALVTGGTRGVGRGVALALAEAGAIVYATGRSITEETFPPETRIVGVSCDHTDGRAIAGLASDPEIMAKSGSVLIAAALAEEYGFTDIDGKQPRPLKISDV